MTDDEAWFSRRCALYGIEGRYKDIAMAEFIRLMAGWTQNGNIDVTTQELEALRERAFGNVRWALFGL